MAVKWQYQIGHYFRERFAPRRLFKLVGYNGPLVCLQLLDDQLQPVSLAQQHPVQGLESVLEPITEQQLNVQRLLYISKNTTQEKITEYTWDEAGEEWLIKRK